MIDSVFLSASIPDPIRAPEYAATADAVAIASAVTALVYVTLGRRQLVWGGHPAITPMVWAVAEELGVDYGRWVKLYQSRFFEDEFPEDNQHFQNVTYTEALPGDRDGSLALMRSMMLSDHQLAAAVFVGGMSGVLNEFEMVRELQPRAALLPVFSGGGAVLEIAKRFEGFPRDLQFDLDYVNLFHRLLRIPFTEKRYPTPDDQPASREQRLWTVTDGPIGRK